MRRIPLLALLAGAALALAGCTGPDAEEPDITAPRDGPPATPFNPVGPGPPQESTNGTMPPLVAPSP